MIHNISYLIIFQWFSCIMCSNFNRPRPCRYLANSLKSARVISMLFFLRSLHRRALSHKQVPRLKHAVTGQGGIVQRTAWVLESLLSPCAHASSLTGSSLSAVFFHWTRTACSFDLTLWRLALAAKAQSIDENRSSLTTQSHTFPLSLPCCRPHGKDPHLSPELPLTADGLDLRQSWPADWQQDLS